eukprot:6180048-Pleurochrysis_carterae.AAC.2
MVPSSAKIEAMLLHSVRSRQQGQSEGLCCMMTARLLASSAALSMLLAGFRAGAERLQQAGEA